MSTTPDPQDQHAAPQERAQLIKVLIEFAPLVAFFLAYLKFGIYWATATIIAVTLVSLLASWIVLKRFAVMPAVTAAVVSVFGGLTLWLDDPTFFYRKPTIVNLLFAAVLGFGLLTGRPLIKNLIGEQIKLTDEGWHGLTVRWTMFFVAMAVLNEIVWRNFTEQVWVNFKVFGILPLTMLFALTQVGFLQRHQVDTK